MTCLNRIARALLVPVLLPACIASATITIETVPVGNAGNPPDPLTGIGQVNYDYRVGKYEVTAAQYTAFLNAVAGVDANELWYVHMSGTGLGSDVSRSGDGTVANPYTYSVSTDYANRPMTDITFVRACRFVNWLEHGQPTGAQGPDTTEDGTYTLTPDGIANNSITRNPGSTWAIANQDEWYKAAFHKNDGVTNHYFLYPTSSDIPPGRDLNDPLGNNANWGGVNPTPIDGIHFRTLVGQFHNSASPYGTFDQGGNLWEFNELINDHYRGMRGGDFSDDVHFLRANEDGFIAFGSPNAGSSFIGVRLVQVPEPASLALLGCAGAWFMIKRRSARQS